MRKLLLVAALALMALGLSTPLGRLRAYQVTCGTTATSLSPPSSSMNAMSSFLVWNNSATAVYIGGPDVNTTTKGFPICTASATCLRSDMPVDGREGFCRVAAGTATVTVLAGLQ
jgi:hypothetical protein